MNPTKLAIILKDGQRPFSFKAIGRRNEREQCGGEVREIRSISDQPDCDS